MIEWDGFHNARDLGALPLLAGGTTRSGVFIRSAGLQFVTDAGWRSAADAGVGTVVDLRNPEEVRAEGGLVPLGIERISVPMDDSADSEFWARVKSDGLDGSPLYFRRFLSQKPDRCAAVVSAMAAVPSGTVLFHCSAGRDRTGLVSLILLSLAGVTPEAIVSDYLLSTAALVPLFRARGVDDQGPRIAAHLRTRGTSVEAAMREVVDGFDASQYLLDAGVAAADIASIRGRLAQAMG